MAQKLKSYFGNPIVSRSYRDTAIGGAIMGLWAAGISPWLVAILGGIVFLKIYFGMIDRVSVKWSFWAVGASYAVGAAYVVRFAPFLSPWLLWALFELSFLAVFFGVIGTGNFLFEDKVGVYEFVHTAALFVTVFFFGTLFVSFSWVWGLPFFLLTVLLMREFFSFVNVFDIKRRNVFAGAAGLISVELLLLSAFLPLGFMNAAIFVTLFLFVGRNIVASYGGKTLTKQALFIEISTFVAISLIIFSTVQWTI